ncbi:related to Dicer-like protein 2 [Phialocephala subalpina]|uniref:Related to Dicer-like protein 2 n=1 Tax=Phialocephala subalpina TaxID=576137 RepID=A0A1L7WE78_9HELO|nr:related to Dicer-like protein 2 [Phialocephala subalpina]
MATLGLLAETNIRPRAYQLEMLEESLKGNIIVAMGTGSGKTQIAVLRISAELEICQASQIIWFLAPTVSLCEQQYNVLSLHLPSVGIRLLLGRDNVDRWSSQHIWDTALSGARIVVSTYAVLADALSHGFVVMAKLALLIFDEAHHCVRNHPANKIMKGYYHHRGAELGSTSRPKILGLTASPIVRSKPEELRVIEANLDSITKTPRINRQELARHVHIPELIKIVYPENGLSSKAQSSTLKSLLDRVQDSENQWLGYKPCLLSAEETAGLSKSSMRGRNWSTSAQEQLKRFSARSRYIQQELGAWASDYYISATISRATLSMHLQQNTHLDWKDEERIHILNTLGQIPVAESLNPPSLQKISNKCDYLFRFLKGAYNKDFRGLIFVEQRVTAIALCQLLSEHPETKNLFTSGTFVGTSTNQSRTTELADLLDQKCQREVLKNFCEGSKNIIIATSALEEGIDVSACNVVICFNKPPNLKSFIQRRGRARHEKSTFMILLSSDDNPDLGAAWERMESEMIEEYMRESRQLDDKERRVPDEIEDDSMTLRIESTGLVKPTQASYIADFPRARLTLDEAVGHLHHFCATLPAYRYLDSRPTFTFQTESTTGLIRGFVTLPNSVHPSVRQASSLRSWQKENMAAKDAAFQAYVGLYKAGLLNDNILPLLPGDEFEETKSTEDLSSMVKIQQQHNPWLDIAKKSATTKKRYLNSVKVRVAGEVVVSTKLMLPTQICSLPWSPLPEQGIRCEICIDDSEEITDLVNFHLGSCPAGTKSILQKVCGTCITSCQNSSLAQFAPPITQDELRAWIRHFSIDNFEGSRDAPLEQHHGTRSAVPLVSVPISQEAEATNVTKWLHDHNRFAEFVPHILYHLETLLLGGEMVDRLQLNVHLNRVDLVAQALCLPSANAQSNNTGLAFLGDTVLDFLVMGKLFTAHTTWHEGCLSAKRKLIISNAHISKMALRTGLDKFIVTKSCQERSSEFPNTPDTYAGDIGRTRDLSKKAIANVVEALIGTAYLQGKLKTALQCAQIFIPELLEHPADCSLRMACGRRELGGGPHFGTLEMLMGYKFHNTSILTEAMTHPSCEQDLATYSYGRLAVLGSSVLSMIIVESLYHENEIVSGNQLQLLRAATINKEFLAFLCIDTSLSLDYHDIQQSGPGQFCKVQRQRNIPLWSFMRLDHSEIVSDRAEFLQKHAETLQGIRLALASGMTYPWRDLANLEANAYFSEIVRSLFGAVYADSNGDILQCSLLAEKLKILPIMRRLMQDNVDIMHPKNRLGELVGDRSVIYRPESTSANNYRCIVRVDGRQIGDAQTAPCKQGAMIRAAEQALRILDSKE